MRFLLLNSRDIIVILKQHPLQKVMVDLVEELSLPEESKTCLFGKKITAHPRQEKSIYSSETGDQ